MSGAAIVGAVTAAVAAGASIYSSKKQSKATKQAADQQAKSSAQQLNQQQQEFNRANQNEVDVSSILDSAQEGDSSATMLTGAGGIERDKLSLGGVSSLLGG